MVGRNHVGADFIVWTLRLSITSLLSEVISARSLNNYARRMSRVLNVDLKASVVQADLDSPESLGSFLGSCVGAKHFTVALVLVDRNEAYGFELKKINKNSEAAALDHGAQHWCVVVAVNGAAAIIADPCAKEAGRLWKCDMSNLQKALIAGGGSDIVLLTKH